MTSEVSCSSILASFASANSAIEVVASPLWPILFVVVAYLSFVLCLYAAIRSGSSEAVYQVLALVVLVIGYWLLESWATHAANFYYYPPAFIDMIPYFDWGQFSWFTGEGFACPTFCPASPPPSCPAIDHSAGISLSVPVTEASLTFAALRTAQLVAPTLILLQPFLVGLCLLAVDLFLDPVTSWSCHCLNESELEKGIGFWVWFVTEDLGIQHFGIPLFNFAAWFCAPIAGAALALLIMRSLSALIAWIISGAPPPNPIESLLISLIFSAFTLLFAISPIGSGTINFKIWMMIVVVVGTVVYVWSHRSHFVHDNTPWRWSLILPLVLFHLFAIVALPFSGTISLGLLILVGIVCVVLGVWYAISPYWSLPF